jgi:hypothetical protein
MNGGNDDVDNDDRRDDSYDGHVNHDDRVKDRPPSDRMNKVDGSQCRPEPE